MCVLEKAKTESENVKKNKKIFAREKESGKKKLEHRETLFYAY